MLNQSLIAIYKLGLNDGMWTLEMTIVPESRRATLPRMKEKPH